MKECGVDTIDNYQYDVAAYPLGQRVGLHVQDLNQSLVFLFEVQSGYHHIQ